MNRVFYAVVLMAVAWCSLAARAQSAVPVSAEDVQSPVEIDFGIECAKDSAKLKLFPEDKFDAGALCRCAFKAIKGDARMITFLPKISTLNLRNGNPPEQYRYYAAKLFSALMSCKSEQLNHLADSGALDASAAVELADRVDSASPSLPPKTLVSPSYDTASAECRPQMPTIAVRTGATGVTNLKFLVEKSGRVTKFWIVRSSGQTLAHKVLDLQAVAAMAGCRFSPATESGVPIDQMVTQEFRWALE